MDNRLFSYNNIICLHVHYVKIKYLPFSHYPGISDYRDGTRGKEWQPHAALAAAAVMKAIVAAMPPPAD